MATRSPLRVGDRVVVRDRPWRVRKLTAISPEQAVIGVEALDGAAPHELSVVVPPDDLATLPPEGLAFDLNGLDTFAAWRDAHLILGATAVRETGMLHGARFGRVALEAYQLAPALRLLAKPRPSLLIADDVGLGKTIETGLAILELRARGRAGRILIVTPPGLLHQWAEELAEKFALAFRRIGNAADLSEAQSDLPAGVSPWDALPQVLTSMDYIKKQTVHARALRKPWDLIVVDEAHALAESGTPQNPYATQRTRLGHALRAATRGLVLLTATPHNGYSHSFRSLLELVEPTLATFQGAPDQVERRIESARIRRMKAQIRPRAGAKATDAAFPPRHVSGIPVRAPSAKSAELLRQVAGYCAKTAKAAKDDEDADLVSFAMQIIKKRALSSREALRKTIGHRLEALKKDEAREAPPPPAEVREFQAALPIGDAAAERTARRILRSAIPKEERRRKSEVKALTAIKRTLDGLGDGDPKIEALLAELRAVLATPAEKVIVFTEYLDTLAAIRERLDADVAFAGRYAVLQGGLSSRQRLARQAEFEGAAVRVLLATDAASEGLNLQRACHRVIHVELPWNPNRLEQRNGRVDRYGQRREPEIRYLFYPDSPEDDVLHRLVEKIEQMAKDRISTADTLGVVEGNGEIERGLVELDPEAPDVGAAADGLVRHFEDRTAEFVRQVQPLVTAGGTGEDELARLVRLLDTAEPLLPDDAALEALVTALLGPRAVQQTGRAGILRITVPLALQGPGVAPRYEAVTFRRSVAVQTPADEVAYVTPMHPLVQALAADARRRFLQVYAGQRGLPVRRLAACVAPKGEATSALFTYLVAVSGGAGLLEERLLGVRIASDGTVLGDPDPDLGALRRVTEPGEVRPEVLRRVFERGFAATVQRAEAAARGWMQARIAELRTRRAEQAAVLRRDLDRDLADRLAEIEAEEKQRRGLVDAKGQAQLFAQADVRGVGLAGRQEAARSQAAERLKDIEAFARVDAAGSLRPMGALFLVPKGT